MCLSCWIYKLISSNLYVGGKNQKKCPAKSKSCSTEHTPKSRELSAKAFEEAENFQSRSKYPSVVIAMQPAYVENGYLVRS